MKRKTNWAIFSISMIRDLIWILIKIGKKKIRTPIESWANLMNRQFTEVDYTLSNLKVEKKPQRHKLISYGHHITSYDIKGSIMINIMLTLAYLWLFNDRIY